MHPTFLCFTVACSKSYIFVIFVEEVRLVIETVRC